MKCDEVIQMRSIGIEPRSQTWKALMLTIAPRTRLVRSPLFEKIEVKNPRCS